MINKKRASNHKSRGIMISIILFVLALVAFFELSARADGMVAFTFLMNGVLSGIMVVYSSGKRRYSLETIHWIFFFFFFFFAPVVQYAADAFPWKLRTQTDELLKANMLLFGWGILFFLGCKAKRNERFVENTGEKRALRVNPSILNLFTVVSVGITIYLLGTVGLSDLLSRATNDSFSDIESHSLGLLIEKFMQAFVLFTFVFCILNKEKNSFRTAISFLCLLICIFPFGVARNTMAIVYVGLFALLFENILSGRRFTYAFLIGLIIIFPLLSAFRASSIEEVQVTEVLQRILSEFLAEYTTADYDAYSMLIQTFRYTDRFGVEYGMQFIGALLFFVPRAMWASKPIGSGATIMERFGRDFTNVSCPLPGEFFINFGSVGLLIGAFAVGYFIRRLDNAYWKRKLLREENDYTYVDIIYPFLLAALFFMLRGDLMSSLAYSLSYVVVAYFMYFIAVKKGKFGL